MKIYRPVLGRPKGSKGTPLIKIPRPGPDPDPVGRPLIYTKELADEICELLGRGIPLIKICKMEGIPSYSTVIGWLWKDTEYKKEFLNNYNEARRQQADYFAEEIVTIADDGENDTYTKYDKDGNPIKIINFDHIGRSKLRMDARKWYSSKVEPKKYGDKIEQRLTGKDGEDLIPKQTTIILDFGI